MLQTRVCAVKQSQAGLSLLFGPALLNGRRFATLGMKKPSGEGHLPDWHLFGLQQAKVPPTKKTIQNKRHQSNSSKDLARLRALTECAICMQNRHANLCWFNQSLPRLAPKTQQAKISMRRNEHHKKPFASLGKTCKKKLPLSKQFIWSQQLLREN